MEDGERATKKKWGKEKRRNQMSLTSHAMGTANGVKKKKTVKEGRSTHPRG